jgi:hypothetical protein
MRLSQLPILFLSLAAGCYRYDPAPGVTPVTGDEVRFTLSQEAAQELAPVLGARTRSLTGRILADGGTAYTFAVDRTFKDDGVVVVWAGDRVSIPRSGVAQTDRRVLDRKKSMLVTGGAILGALVATVVLAQLKGEGNPGQPPPPPPPPP